jgi:nitrate reductase (cytochrome)
MTTSDRRTFLKRTALASAAAAASSLMPGVFFGAVSPQVSAADAVVWRKTPCRFCGVGCGLLLGIENGRAVAVKGDPDSPVNRGLACVKGYHSVQALYGSDRLLTAKVRRNGRLVDVPIREALDLVAEQLRETISAHGKDSVGIYGSGQWTVPDGYVASKLFKGALGTNNVEASTRLGLGSAISGCRTSFGVEQSTGCYEDIDHADIFVLWGSNLAETHPVLFSRLLARRQEDQAVRIIALGSRSTRTSYAADRSLLYAPQSELAIANAICGEIVTRNWVDRDFVESHVAFRRGRTTAGSGFSGEIAENEDGSDAGWNDYTRFLADYTPERAQQISGMPASDIRWLASLYGDRSRRIVSLWGAELNEHSRGTWANNLIHNIHLLVGKIAAPGNGPFALADQPSDVGSVVEVGTLAGRLPRGEVTNEEDRNRAAEIWGVPVARIDPAPGHHAISMFRALDDGGIRFLWVQASNPMVSLPNLGRYRSAAAKEGRFLVVSEVYPTPTTDLADVVLPSAMWIEREGIFGSAERRIQHFEQMLAPPGEAMSDTWQLMEVARRLGFGDLFPWDQASHIEGIWAEYTRFRGEPAERLPPLSTLKDGPGVIWPYVDGQETRWRYNTSHDPAADQIHGAFDFYGTPDHRARIWLRPYEPPDEVPDAEFPFWFGVGRVLEQYGTGTLTRRIPTLHRAMPAAYVEVNREDALEMGIRGGETVRLVSRRGSLEMVARIDHRAQPPRGQLFAPSFDESRPVNQLTLDAYCPVSGQPDYGKCAVRLERLGSSTAP